MSGVENNNHFSVSNAVYSASPGGERSAGVVVLEKA